MSKLEAMLKTLAELKDERRAALNNARRSLAQSSRILGLLEELDRQIEAVQEQIEVANAEATG